MSRGGAGPKGTDMEGSHGAKGWPVGTISVNGACPFSMPIWGARDADGTDRDLQPMHRRGVGWARAAGVWDRSEYTTCEALQPQTD